MKRLFHGSKFVIENPEFGTGKPFNDYGPGFYCTEHLDIACEWAVGFDHAGYANEYLFDNDGLFIVDLNGPQYTALNWLTVLLKNRWFDIRSPLAHEARSYLLERFDVDLSEADVVEGYRADDSYFTFAQDFISGGISYRQLSRALNFGDLGRQTVLKSKRSFERIQFVGVTNAPRELWLPKRERRDRKAREQYFDFERNARKQGDLFISDIIDKKMGPNDVRLR